VKIREQQRIYLAGPMRGIPDYNFPAFHEAAATLRFHGHKVWSPAERDLEANRDPNEVGALPLKVYMADDLKAVCESEAVVLLPGWESSVGANLEVQVARTCDIPVYLYPSMEKLSESPTLAIEWGEETRVTDDDTGGQKGSKLARFDLISVLAQVEEAKVYGRGAQKYEDNNWRRGYAWSLSYAALLRHLAAFWAGEDRDPETGLLHLAHARWHTGVLIEFMLRELGSDDRVKIAA
jgi:hypothetical protein